MNFECNICMTNEVKRLLLLNCNHLFHSDCIDKWLKQSNTCPYCKVEFSDFNNIEKFKSECEKLESECMSKRKERRSLIEERRSLIEEKNY